MYLQLAAQRQTIYLRHSLIRLPYVLGSRPSNETLFFMPVVG